MAKRKVNPFKGRYFVVNPGGAVHEVTREQARERLALPGWRKATAAERDALLNAPAHKGFGPVTARWNPDPDAGVELDEDEAPVEEEQSAAQ